MNVYQIPKCYTVVHNNHRKGFYISEKLSLWQLLIVCCDDHNVNSRNTFFNVVSINMALEHFHLVIEPEMSAQMKQSNYRETTTLRLHHTHHIISTVSYKCI